jgi:competence protein ComFC
MANGLRSLLLPTACPVCGAAGPAPCAGCWRSFRPAPPGPVPAGLDRCRSLLSYDGPARELLARLKYRNARSALAWLVAGMAALVADAGVDVVTWAPTTAARRRQRGYDQAELLARGVARSLGLPCRRLLRRLPGPPQTGRSRAERWHGPAFASRAPPGATRLRGVLLVDDLLTTGATLSSAASTLRTEHGAMTVIAVTAGRTPRRSQLPRP